MPDVVMPRLSDSMEEGTILKWLKAAGDEVSKGDELVEIETDKATMTYEADADGTLEIVAGRAAHRPREWDRPVDARGQRPGRGDRQGRRRGGGIGRRPAGGSRGRA